MDTIIAALIGISGTLLVALLAVGPLLKALGKQIEVHDNDSSGRKGELSKEHAGLSKGLSGVQSDITFLKEGRIADEARRETMKTQALDTQKALDVLNTALGQMADQRAELDKLQKENAKLQEENTALLKENAILRQELEQGQGRDEEELEP